MTLIGFAFRAPWVRGLAEFTSSIAISVQQDARACYSAVRAFGMSEEWQRASGLVAQDWTGLRCVLAPPWKDDARSTVEAMQVWCDAFEDHFPRQLRLWLDTVCINQNNTEEDLMCVPVCFPGGCKSLVVTVGPTYHTSLWCLLGPVVHLSMATSEQSRRPPNLSCLARIGQHEIKFEMHGGISRQHGSGQP